MFKPSGVLTFCDWKGKPHLQIFLEFFEKQAAIKRAAFKKGYRAAKIESERDDR